MKPSFIFTALLALAVSAGCSHGSAKRPNESPSPTASPARTYPAGIVPPANPRAALRAGIYPADPSGQCCFLAGRSLLTLNNPRDSQLVIFTFYVPSVRPFLNGPERVGVTFDGAAAGSALLAPGEHNATFAIPKSVRNTAHLVATLTMSTTYVPQKLGINGDVRELSILLLKVGYI